MSKIDEGVPPEPKVQPNIEAIIQLIVSGGEIDNAEKAQAEAMSGIGGIYKKVEKNFHANRGAVSLIRKMLKMSADKRADFIRTLEPLLVHFKMTLDDIDPDLADMASKSPPKGPSGDEDDDQDDAPDTPGSNAGMSALESARARLGGDDAAPKAARASVDNSRPREPGEHEPAKPRGKARLGVVHPITETRQ